MGRILVMTLKYGLFAVAVLLASQIRYDGRRICDHVADALASRTVSAPLRWAAERFDFKQPAAAGGGSSRARARAPSVGERAPESEFTRSDRATLSGLLKKQR